MNTQYTQANSLMHRLPVGVKLCLLIIISTGLFFITAWPLMCVALCIVLILYKVTKIPSKTLIAQIKPALWLCLFLFAAQSFFNHWEVGVLVSVRLMTLLLLASLLTLTTRMSDMIDTLQASLGWLTWFHINPAKVSLAISLTLRFIPVISRITEEVREAQKARGLEKSLIALAIPVIIRTLKSADDVADAITSRGFE